MWGKIMIFNAMQPMETCWLTGVYSEACDCFFCLHKYDCPDYDPSDEYDEDDYDEYDEY